MKIIISAGHQVGLDSGAVGQGQQEAVDNVRMCDRIVQYLTKWGIDVVYMPNNVGDLSAEIKWVNDRFKEGDAYAIQIHRNAGGGTGNEVWTTAYKNQVPLASSILSALTAITGLTSRGVKDIKTSKWPLGWINYVNCESVLVEARFIDRDPITDADDYLDAYAIAVGIAKFLGAAYGKTIEQEEADRVATAAKAASEAAAQAAAAVAKAQAEAEAKLVAQAEALAKAKAAEAAAQAAAKNTYTDSDRAVASDTNAKVSLIVSIVTWIKDLLSRVFK